MADQLLIMEHGEITKSGDPVSLFSNRKVSGKFQFTGEILSIKPADVIFIVTVLIGKNIVKVVADKKTAENLSVGNQVVVVSKAFNPLIYKLDPS
jgi:molybdate transport system ATP-binding protein